MALRTPLQKIVRKALVLGSAGALAVLLASFYVEHRYEDRIVSAGSVPTAPVALVFGAGLASNQSPSPLLAERIDTAISLYRAGKVRKLLVSGDNSDRSHDETRAMRRYAMSHGVPTQDVIGDYAGLSTYDSCFRARAIFGVARATLVTQRFHLARALFIANALGIDAFGVAADEATSKRSPYALREFLSRPLALALVVTRPDPRFLGDREPIPLPP
jgi:vancomycin permeability regulator SanA